MSFALLSPFVVVAVMFVPMIDLLGDRAAPPGGSQRLQHRQDACIIVCAEGHSHRRVVLLLFMVQAS